MIALDQIDREIAWWETKSRAMKHPREQLALACAIGAITGLQRARSAIAAITAWNQRIGR